MPTNKWILKVETFSFGIAMRSRDASMFARLYGYGQKNTCFSLPDFAAHADAGYPGEVIFDVHWLAFALVRWLVFALVRRSFALVETCQHASGSGRLKPMHFALPRVIQLSCISLILTETL